MRFGVSVYSHADPTPVEVSAYCAARVPGLKQHGNEWRGLCPIHNAKTITVCVEEAFDSNPAQPSTRANPPPQG